VAQLKRRGTLALVPTMGALHAGHMALVEEAQRRADSVAATIFVNPMQFGAGEDLDQYPRRESEDAEMLERAGCELIWVPSTDDIYPGGFATTIKVSGVSERWEGEARPGHFDGVATVVAILFDLVGAEHAYFGQKDAQQVMVIRQMARDLAIPTQVIACPTVREPDGLALSSRNVHLSPDERAAAPVLRRALLAGRDLWAGGERSGDAIRVAMAAVLAEEPLADPEYVSVADGLTLAELETIEGPALLSLAVRFGTTRLIDNEPIGLD